MVVHLRRGLEPLDLVDRDEVLEHLGMGSQVRRLGHRIAHHGLGPVREDDRCDGRGRREALECGAHVRERREGVVRLHQRLDAAVVERVGRNFGQSVPERVSRDGGERLVAAHAVEAPGVLELVLAPGGRDGLGSVRAEVGGEGLCDGFRGEERTVEVEGDDDLFGRHGA